MSVAKISPSVLGDMLKQKSVCLVDVREPFEYRREHIAEAILCPSASMNPDKILPEASKIGAVCFICASGGRSAKAADAFLGALAKSDGACDRVKVFDLTGGMSSWRVSGMPVVEDTRAPLPIIRQVHLIASTMIISGSLLSQFYSPKFIILPIFVGCGLFVSGSTGFCGMATILSRLPYNRA